jgi:plasmid stabilization system protein ParE
MNFRLHFSERSKPEIQEAYNWYEDQQVDLGEEFLLALDEAFARITSHPFSFSQKKGIFRECYVGKFPFLVVYKVKGTNVYIHAVFHTSRNPKKKK